MGHWIFLVNLLAFTSGVAVLIFLLLILARKPGAVFRNYFGVFTCLLFISLISIFDLYLEANLPLVRPEIRRWYFDVMAVAVATFIYFLVRIYSGIFGSRRLLAYLQWLSPVAAAAVILCEIFFPAAVPGIVLSYLKLSALVAGIFFLGIILTPWWHARRIADLTLRRYLYTSYLLVALLLSLYATKQLTADSGEFFAVFGRVHFSVFFIVHNLITLYFAGRHLAKPAAKPASAGAPGEIHLSENFASRFGITPRERVIIEEIIGGKSNREISRAVDVTEGTVKIFVHNIYKKTGVNNRMALAALVRQSAN